MHAWYNQSQKASLNMFREEGSEREKNLVKSNVIWLLCSVNSYSVYNPYQVACTYYGYRDTGEPVGSLGAMVTHHWQRACSLILHCYSLSITGTESVVGTLGTLGWNYTIWSTVTCIWCIINNISSCQNEVLENHSMTQNTNNDCV